ncbi:MAG TPA: hypothetical protein VF071_03650 [Candidatus Limnocylindria bacterium]|jgi:hypothetical protein
MRTFMVIAPDGRKTRVSFSSEHEAEANAEAMREAGMTIIPLYWSRTLQRYVSVPEE